MNNCIIQIFINQKQQNQQVMRTFLKVIVFIFLCEIKESSACTIFTASNENTVLVGNNEDNTPTLKSYLWFYPTQKSKHGFVTWGNSKKFPEGGMNEKGLFWDAAAMPNKIPIIAVKNKENFKGYFVEKALSECATVEELLALVSKFNLIWQEKAQVLVADAYGDYAIIHSNYVIRKSDIKKDFFSLANYCINDPNTKTYQCHRQGFAQNILSKNPTISIDLFKNILQKTAQTEVTNATIYSQICDLKNGSFHLYQKYDFNESKVLHLKDELQKGERTVEIKDYFTKSISDEVAIFFDKKNYMEATKTYEKLRDSKSDLYNFSFRSLDDLGYSYLRSKKNDVAIEVFKLNLKYHPEADEALSSLACAYLANMDYTNSKKYFDQALSKNPKNYMALLFQPENKGVISFKVNHFEGVEKLSLVGSFNDFKPNANPFTKDENGIWTCEIKLPPGEYRYKLFVGDGNWYTDPLNKYLINPEKYWDNYLKVE